jgi:ribosome recycling factor
MDHQLITDLKIRYNKVLEIVEEDISTVRVGRAKPDMVNGIIVEAYGSKMKLMEVASVTAPDSNLIQITPYDKGLMRDIEKAIGESDLGLSPAVSGEMIRIVLPALTQDRRLDFVKLLKQKIESGKVLLRQARQDIKEQMDDMKGQPGVSEDLIHTLHEQLDKVTEEWMVKITEMEKTKELEIMAV